MKISEAYKLSMYKDYGPLGEKEHVRLVKDIKSGKICVQKILDGIQSDIIVFREQNLSPYFPKLFEVIEDENKYMIIEEYVEGVTLEEYMKGEPVPEKIAARIAIQICEALQCLHNHKPMIIYRDLKPENIMITPEENVKLVDFDIARKYQEGKTQDTELLGTAVYAAPEQFGYSQTDNRTDIYAFGVLFNYMLTGKIPTEYVTEGKYSEMVRKCIELDPNKRYQNVEKILKDFSFWESAFGKIPQRKHRQTKNDYLIHKSWKIPGFRIRELWKKIVALLGYGYILYINLTMEYTNMYGGELPIEILWFRRVAGIICDIASVLVAFNYRGISKKIPLYRHRFLIVRILTFIVTLFMFRYIGFYIVGKIEYIFLEWYW